MARPWRVVLSCEHGGNHVPARYRSLFQHYRRALNGHRGYDIGALPLARYLAGKLDVPLIASTVTRLLVDLNRSLHHRQLFGAPVRDLDETVRQRIIDRYYTPYRTRIEQLVADDIAGGHAVLHLSVHSFTPVWRGETRQADIGLLYDPARRPERHLCADLAAALRDRNRRLRTRRNYPYRGTADGLTTALRKKFAADRYAGIELEINQRLALARTWSVIQKLLGETLARVVDGQHQPGGQ